MRASNEETKEFFSPQLFFSQASSSASPAFGRAGPMLSQQSQLLLEHRTVGFAKSWHIVAQLINQALRTPEKSINVSSDSYFLSSVNMAVWLFQWANACYWGVWTEAKRERKRCLFCCLICQNKWSWGQFHSHAAENYRGDLSSFKKPPFWKRMNAGVHNAHG